MKNKNTLQLFVIFMIMITIGSCNSQITKETNSEKSIGKKINEMKAQNEIIVDVRTTEEWENDGHAACSVNYPLDQIQNKIEELKKYERVVLVCRSGARAGVAKGQLEGAGITNVENKGPWQNINCNN